eukprot:1161024-Pelagomonas_calceolata.AAC.13
MSANIQKECMLKFTQSMCLRKCAPRGVCKKAESMCAVVCKVRLPLCYGVGLLHSAVAIADEDPRGQMKMRPVPPFPPPCREVQGILRAACSGHFCTGLQTSM